MIRGSADTSSNEQKLFKRKSDVESQGFIRICRRAEDMVSAWSIGGGPVPQLRPIFAIIHDYVMTSARTPIGRRVGDEINLYCVESD